MQQKHGARKLHVLKTLPKYMADTLKHNKSTGHRDKNKLNDMLDVDRITFQKCLPCVFVMEIISVHDVFYFGHCCTSFPIHLIMDLMCSICGINSQSYRVSSRT